MFGDLGKVVGGALGGIAGNALLPGLGGILGKEIGSLAGSALGGQVWNMLQQNPMQALGNPMGIASKFVDNLLGKMGVQADFRAAIKFAGNPTASIEGSLKFGFEKPQRPIGNGGTTAPEQGLTTNGKDVVDTGRYLISGKEGEVKIYDKQTNTWVQAHGDPHLATSDGDKGQFHENLTIDLPDGTKVTIKTTPKDANGIALIDGVAVMKGDEAVVMAGFSDGQAGVKMGNVLNNADAVDAKWADGTVLRAGAQVDDLTFAADGTEIVGGDPNARWGEHNLDGKGGISRNSPDASALGTGGGIAAEFKQLMNQIRDLIAGRLGGKGGGGGQAGETGQTGGAGQTGGTEGTSGTGGASGGGSIYDKLFALMAKMQKQLEGKVKDMDGLDPQKDKAQLDKMMFDVQQLQNQMSQLLQMATNMSKTEHESRMGIARNLAP